MFIGDAGEDVLVLLEEEVKRWKDYHMQNHELLSTLDHFHKLYRHMLELEDRAKDPSRLFNTRGGALLLEEKAKKKVSYVSHYNVKYCCLGCPLVCLSVCLCVCVCVEARNKEMIVVDI